MQMLIDTLIHAKTVLPMEPDFCILHQHSIAINHGKIVAVLPTAEAMVKYQAKHTVDRSQHVVLPGLVNTHTHTPMTLLRGYANDVPIKEWLENHIWPVEVKWVDPEFMRIGMRLAIAEMIKSGTTCFNDIYFFVPEAAAITQSTGIRGVIGITMLEFETRYADQFDTYMRKGLEAYEQFKNDPLVSFSYGPHSTYSLSEPALKKLAQQWEKLPLPIHIHVHEAAWEPEKMREQYGVSAVGLLDRLGLLNQTTHCAHMTTVDDHDIQLLQKRGAHVLHCPSSNMKLASGICPVKRFLDAGINVGLGTDGTASNDSLDMFKEMKLAALLAKVSTSDPSAVPAYRALQMATLYGARAMSMGDKIGSLIPGKQADLIAVDMDSLCTSPYFHPDAALVYAASAHQVSDVWVAGKALLQNGQLTTLDESLVKAEAVEFVKKF